VNNILFSGIDATSLGVAHLLVSATLAGSLAMLPPARRKL
jgi:hypothetical protein